jgi:hypothetical protein
VRTVLKFMLNFGQGQQPTPVEMPKNAIIRHVGFQPGRMIDGQLGIWAECDANDQGRNPLEGVEMVTRRFYVHGTGHPIVTGRPYVGGHPFVASVIAGDFVWHVYEEGKTT